MDDRYRSRKFGLSVAFSAAGMIALFSGQLGGGEFIGLAGTVLGLYAVANVAEQQVQK